MIHHPHLFLHNPGHYQPRTKMLDLKQQQYEGEVTNGSCGLIPQTKAAILIQIAFIIIIIITIIMFLSMMMMMMMTMTLLRQSPLEPGCSSQLSSHDRWTLDIN